MHGTTIRAERALSSAIRKASVFLLLAGGLAFPAPSLADDDCDALWTIGGKGSEAPWIRVNGYRIGMAKSQAQQIRRAGMTTSIAQDTWHLDLDTTHVGIEFHKDQLISATITLIGRDFQEAYADVVEQMGTPDDFGQDYILWRSEACDTIKILKKDEDKVVVAIQKLARSKKRPAKKN